MDELVDQAAPHGEAPSSVPTTSRADSGGGRSVPGWAAFLAGAAAALVGLAPWLISGARLPLQNLGEGGIPAEAPVVLLPFSQYMVTSIFAVLVVGGAVAGIAARALVARDGARAPAWWIGCGLATAQVFAVVQTVAVVSAGLRDGRDSAVYLVGIGSGVVVCLLISVGAFILIALAPRAGALFGLSTGAIAVGLWLPIAVVDPISSMPAQLWLLRAIGYVMPILVGVAIVWAGVRTVGRVVSALVSLVLVWLGPALTTALWSALGSRVLAREPAVMLEYGVGIFRQYATDAGLVREPLAIAVAVAVIGLSGREVLRRRAHPAEHTG